MVTIVRSPWTAAPEVTPRSGGILDVATVTARASHLRAGGLGLTYNCLDTVVGYPLCGPRTEKEFSSPSTVEGFEFAVYAGLTCKPFGFDEDEALAQVKRIFQMRESQGVEKRLMDVRFAADASGDDLWEAAEDITPTAGALPIREAVAALEGYAAGAYVGQPTLHLPTRAGSLAATRKAIMSTGGRWYTQLGAKVVVGAGYEVGNKGPDGTPAPEGERWLYATGEVLVTQGTMGAFFAHDESTNDQLALAERPYTAAIDCFAVAVRAEVA